MASVKKPGSNLIKAPGSAPNRHALGRGPGASRAEGKAASRRRLVANLKGRLEVEIRWKDWVSRTNPVARQELRADLPQMAIVMGVFDSQLKGRLIVPFVFT